ncbi:SDR family NAD(P)-dependent oxidoreductase [Actinoplanes sp. TBRC 11911]|uniref:SDR family NAD(P)-dependent oxidoreductase n=1 Tax=Actinoplanes sp. TBRC 11911 TaxID=2729386 RepID=UPI00145DD26C|nr:SDR family NAD(P)-dependent oxidoreductase [Actinoplanes sp. TBRC 11911]NMO53727.1 SDR family NAD(P)-dependent oxidoreductase [Actinoplanes sp. TBRC 11911]
MRDGLGRAQTVLVLGGTSEIGAAVADALVPAGGTIILAGRDPAMLDTAAARLRPGRHVETVAYEATGTAAATVDVLTAAAAQAGDLDVVVLCVGALTGEPSIGADSTAAEHALQTNMLGPMLAVHATAQRLRRQGHGTLVVFSSVSAVRARPRLLTYGVAKSALDAYARHIGVSLRGSGARVLVVRPGHVRTRMTAGLAEPPFTTTVQAVAATVARALRRGSAVTYAPAMLRPVVAGLRLLPATIFNRVTELKAAPRRGGAPSAETITEPRNR